MTFKQFLEEYEHRLTAREREIAEAAYRAGFGEGYNEGLVADEVHNDLIYKPWD